MTLPRVLSLIPRHKRSGAVGAIIGSLALAILDFVGIAILIPIILIVLSGEETLANPVLRSIYESFGFTTFTTFVIVVCLAAVSITILKNIFALLISDRINKYLQSLYSYYSGRMFGAYLSKGLLFIRGNTTSQLINDVNGVCLRFTEGVLGKLFIIFTDLALLLFIGIGLLSYDPSLVLLAAMIFIPLTLAYTLIFRRRMNHNGRMENKLFVTQNKMLYETFLGYHDIVINNAEDYAKQRLYDGLHKLNTYRRKATLVRFASGRMAEFSLIFGVSTLIIIGLLSGGEMSAIKVTLGVFAIAAYKIVPAVSRMTSCWIEYKRNSFAAEKISENIWGAETPPRQDKKSSRLSFSDKIVFDNVSFRYGKERGPVLDNFSLTITKGEKIGICGYSGTGKSTLLNLMCGLIPSQDGRIIIDDTQLTRDNCQEWQANIAYVSQDIFLPDVSIAENIAFGIPRSEIDKERLLRAIDSASLSGYISSLPEGVDTTTGEAGGNLSAGQRQRIAIARALYKEASLLILDEATSSLDSKAEADIISSLKGLIDRGNRITIVIVSHRPETLVLCDRIIEL